MAFSAGVDSTFVAAAAADALGERALAVTGVSPSIPASEVEEAKALAAQIGIRHVLLRDVRDGPPRLRRELAAALLSLQDGAVLAARGDGRARRLRATSSTAATWTTWATTARGACAAAEHRVRSPLIEAGLTKAEIRALSKQRGLPTWDKPAMACLSSRIPYGTPVTVEALDQIGAAEAFLRGLGPAPAARAAPRRRRAHRGRAGRTCAAVIEHRERIVTRLKNLGYRYVTLDLAGFRSGSMNEVLTLEPVSGSRP